MRKLFALLLVAGTFAFAACEKKATETTETMDSTTTVEEAPVVDTVTAAPADTTAAAPADTTKK